MPPTSTSTATSTAVPAYGVQWISTPTPFAANAGSTIKPALSFTNSGTLTWLAAGSNPVKLAYHWRNGACPGTSLAVWDGVHTPLLADIATGGTANVTASVNTPGTAGTYCLMYDLIQEGVTWFSWRGAATKAVTVTINQGAYGVAWGANNTPATMTSGTPAAATLSFANAGSLTWSAAGPNAVKLAYHWRNGACGGTSIAVWDGQHNALGGDVASGATVSGFAATIVPPATAGTYCLVYDFIREGITWFSWQGAATLQRTITVN